jgi:spore coat protein A
VKRRHVLGALGLAALGASSFGGLVVTSPRGQTGELLRSRAPLPRPYTVPLPIPPVARPVRTDGTTDFYEIVQREADLEILPGLRTTVMGYDGLFPGPTLVTRSGRPAVVTHTNDLPVPVAVHLHGGHTPTDSDGYPTDLIEPTGRRDYTYPMQQRAATLWYHDHRMDFTGPQVYRGLAGFHIVTDNENDNLGLPSGDRDIPLMITDRAFDEDGSFLYPASHHGAGVTDDFMEGVLGDVVLVNGAPWPVLDVTATRYRLRLLNASNARRYQLSLTPGTPLVQIGSDGGLLEQPVEHASILLAPGERCEVVVDFGTFAPGTEVTLRNNLGTGDTREVLRFRVTGRGSDDSRIPQELSHIEPVRREDAARTREWTFRRAPTGQHPMWLINGLPFDPDRLDAEVQLGETEIWRFTSDLHHPVHVHLDPFQVLSRRGGAPGQHDAGWKDTVDLAPNETVDVAVRFTDYPGRYLVHCHNLEHEDMAMMAAFATT